MFSLILFLEIVNDTVLPDLFLTRCPNGENFAYAAYICLCVRLSPSFPLPSLSFPCYLPPSLRPSVPPSPHPALWPPERPSPSCRPSAYVGLRHALPGRHSPARPLTSREASPLTGLWQPSGIDQ